MQEMTNEETVALAALMHKIDQASSVCPSEMETLKREMARLDNKVAPLLLARKLLEGKPYRLSSDDPETIERCKSLAEYMGAAFCVLGESGWGTHIEVHPTHDQY
jgi:hypothetical protein